MEQKLFKITVQRHNRPDGKIGVLTNIVVHDILPDKSEVPVRYTSSYDICDKDVENPPRKKSA